MIRCLQTGQLFQRRRWISEGKTAGQMALETGLTYEIEIDNHCHKCNRLAVNNRGTFCEAHAKYPNAPWWWNVDESYELYKSDISAFNHSRRLRTPERKAA